MTITLGEIGIALSTFKNEKSPGIDGIVIEILLARCKT